MHECPYCYEYFTDEGDLSAHIVFLGGLCGEDTPLRRCYGYFGNYDDEDKY